MDAKIRKILRYAKSLIGIKYTWWKDDGTDPNDMFFCHRIPTYEELKKRGINCTGLINLMRLKIGLEIPKSIGLEGGTYFWYHYFSKK